MDVTTHLVRAAETPAPVDAVYALLADIPRSIAHFPDVDTVVERDGVWEWRLRRLGAGPLQFQVHYGARYHMDAGARDVRWSAVPEVGNTRVEGRWHLAPHGAGTRFTLDARFLLATPFPRPLRAAVEAVVERETGRLVGGYLENLRVTLGGGDGRAPR